MIKRYIATIVALLTLCIASVCNADGSVTPDECYIYNADSNLHV
jgi:hypothetical protein